QPGEVSTALRRRPRWTNCRPQRHPPLGVAHPRFELMKLGFVPLCLLQIHPARLPTRESLRPVPIYSSRKPSTFGSAKAVLHNPPTPILQSPHPSAPTLFSSVPPWS